MKFLLISLIAALSISKSIKFRVFFVKKYNLYRTKNEENISYN